jgi:thymidylate synthase (FAD)
MEKKLHVQLLSYTEYPEKIIATAAKTCYSPGTTTTNWHKALQDDGSEEEFVQKLRDMGHMSPFEHANFTFGIDGISRACLAQLTRHRIASFSVQSQRYVTFGGDESSFNVEDYFIVPEPIKNLGFEEQFLDDMYAYYDFYGIWLEKLMASGMSEKEAAENARYLLPNAAKTNLVMTMNARELLHFFELRCCNRAQEEIRDLAWVMLGLLQDKFPVIFANCGASCLTSHCKEGKMSCGKPYRKES